MPDPKPRVERWVLSLAEEIGCACRPSGDVARLIQDAVDARRKRGPGRETWATPYYEAYVQASGGCKPDMGPLVAAAKKAENEASELLGQEDGILAARRSFALYCAEMLKPDRAPYFSLMKWAQTWRQYLPRVRF
jgi:hypothetical protein